MRKADDDRRRTNPVTDGADAELDRLRRFRRDLHQIPELDFDLPKTIAYVTRELEAVAARAGERAANSAGRVRVSVFSPSRSAVCCHFDQIGRAHV